MAQKVTRDVFELYGKVTGIGLEQYYRDIETRLELGEFAKSGNRPKDWKSRKENLEELVRRVLIHTTCELDEGAAYARRSEIHEKILANTKSGDSIITFNYDTLVEESVTSTNPIWTPRDGYGGGAGGITHEWTRQWFQKRHLDDNQKSKIRLLKLHGSINWVLYQNSYIRIKHRPYMVRSHSGTPVFDNAAIVPPGWHKRVDRNPYREIWRQARLALEKCRTLAVIGYSLPDTDLIARALFLEASRSRSVKHNLLKELHVADTSEKVRSKIIDAFIPSLGATGIVFRYDSAQQLVREWMRAKA